MVSFSDSRISMTQGKVRQVIINKLLERRRTVDERKKLSIYKMAEVIV